MCAIPAGYGTHTIALKCIELTSDLLYIWPSHKHTTAYFNSLYCLAHTISLTT